MTIEIIDCQRGTPEWLAARAGVPSASCFSDVLAQGKGLTRAKYLRRLAGEIITGQPEETFKNAHTERGNVMEADARDWYSITRGVDPMQVGFIRNGRIGYSPDSLIGNGGLLEIKTAIPSVLIEVIQRGTFPPEHVAQCQGGLLVSERGWIDLVVYWPNMPKFLIRAHRDETYIANLRKELSRFVEELDALVDKIRRYGSGMSEFYAIRRGDALYPDSVESAALFSKLPFGKPLRVEVKQPRNIGRHRLYWSLCQRIANGIDASAENVSDILKIATGHCQIVMTKTHGEVRLPKSIAFHNMDETAFQDFFERCTRTIYEEWGIDPASVADLLAPQETHAA